MSRDETYNGWKGGYATWRVNIELIDGLEPDTFGRPDDIGELAEAIEEWVDEALGLDYHDHGAQHQLVYDYASAFLSSVDWYELARAFATDNSYISYDSDGDLVEEDDE